MLAISPTKWPGMNAAFLVSLIASILLTLAVIPYGKRRPVGKPLSWGEAMLGSIYAFAVLFLAFGVVPHQWIDHADKDLGWSKDNIIYGPGDILKPQEFGGWLPADAAVRGRPRHDRHPAARPVLRARDLRVALVAAARPVATTEVAVSTYGRPLVKKA